MAKQRELATCSEAGLCWRNQAGEQVHDWDDWYVIGQFGTRLSDRCNAESILAAFKRECGEDSIQWCKTTGSDNVWLYADPRARGARWTTKRLAQMMIETLQGGCSVLDEDLFQSKISQHADDQWTRLSLPRRLEVLADRELPSSLAREAALPALLRAEFEQAITDHMDGSPRAMPQGLSITEVEHDGEAFLMVVIKG